MKRSCSTSYYFNNACIGRNRRTEFFQIKKSLLNKKSLSNLTVILIEEKIMKDLEFKNVLIDFVH
jgi:hypothetical protein